MLILIVITLLGKAIAQYPNAEPGLYLAYILCSCYKFVYLVNTQDLLLIINYECEPEPYLNLTRICGFVRDDTCTIPISGGGGAGNWLIINSGKHGDKEVVPLSTLASSIYPAGGMK